MLKVAEEECYQKTKHIEELDMKNKMQNEIKSQKIHDLELYVKKLKKCERVNLLDLQRCQDMLYEQSEQIAEAMKHQEMVLEQ